MAVAGLDLRSACEVAAGPVGKLDSEPSIRSSVDSSYALPVAEHLHRDAGAAAFETADDGHAAASHEVARQPQPHDPVVDVDAFDRIRAGLGLR